MESQNEEDLIIEAMNNLGDISSEENAISHSIPTKRRDRKSVNSKEKDCDPQCKKNKHAISSTTGTQSLLMNILRLTTEDSLQLLRLKSVNLATNFCGPEMGLYI